MPGESKVSQGMGEEASGATMDPPLVDAHCHLPSPGEGSIGGEAIGRLAVNSASESEWQEVLALAKSSPMVLPFLGIHPWWAGEAQEGWEERLTLLLGSTRAGVGEIGLDALAAAPAALQEKLFVQQLGLAEKFALPVTIHCCRRWGRLLDLLAATLTGRARVIIHGYGGSLETMHRLLDLGAMVSFGPALADPAREKVRALFRTVPLDRLLLESDWAPRQQRSPPWRLADGVPGAASTLASLYRIAAELRGMDTNQLRALLWGNGQALT